MTYKKHSITTKFLGWFLLAALLPLFFFGYVSYRTSIKMLEHEVINNLIVLADNKVSHIETYITERKKDATMLARTPSVVSAMEKFEKIFMGYGIDSPEYVAVDKQFRQFFTYFKEISGFYDFFLITLDGDVVFTVEKEADLGANLVTGIYNNSELANSFDRARTLLGVDISDFDFYAPSNLPAAFITVPIFKEKILIGVFALQMRPEAIYALTKDYTGLGKTGETVIAAQKGNKVIFVAPTRHDLLAAFGKNIAFGSKKESPIQNAVQGKRGFGKSIDYRGTEILAVWRYLPYLRWGIVVKMDAKEAFKQAYNLRSRFLNIGIITILVVGIIALFVSRSITGPIIKLTQATKSITAEDLTSRINIKSKDEIGILSESFNKMTKNLHKAVMLRDQEITERKKAEEALKENSDHLEEMVEKRTKELRDAQEELVRKEKLAILGELSGGVGHELRNPLGVISNAIYYLKAVNPDADEKTKEYLEIISSEAGNAEKIVSDLLAFPHTKPGQREEITVSELVTLVFEKKPPPKEIKVTTEFAPDLCSVYVDPRQIEQVLTNLITNACQAMPEGGGLTIKGEDEKGRVRISISDTGCGISSECLKKIFEPLFTTRARGIGLGLTVTRNLIDANGGSIEVKSEIGKGSAFTFTLPYKKEGTSEN